MPTGKSSSAKAKKTRKTAAKPAKKKVATKARSASGKKKTASRAKTATKRTAAKAKTPPKSKSGVLGVAPGYIKALAEYEKAMDVLQKRQFERAAILFQRLIDNHPDERDLVDRARVYVKTCLDKTTEAAEPEGFDDHYYEGVMQANRAEFHDAVAHFKKALQINPNSDKVHYSLAASHARLGAREEALVALRRAVELDPSARVHARQDSDFADLKGDPEFDALVATEAAREPVG